MLGFMAVMLALLGGCGSNGPERRPLADFDYTPKRVQAGDEVHFDGSYSHVPGGTDIVDYAWDFGDGTTADGVHPVHVYAAEGRYTVTLTVTSEGGGEGKTQQELEISPEETPPPTERPRAAFTRQPASGTAPLTVSFDASASTGEIVAYTWDFDDGATGSGETTEHTFTSAGTYNVRLTVRDDEGREDSAQRTVTVREEGTAPPGDGPQAAFELEPDVGELPLTVSFDASASTGDIVAYTWDFGDGATGSGATATHTYTEAGKHEVRLTVRDGEGREATAEGAVYAYPPIPGPPG